VFDFGALEIQAVYISGNVRDPFEYYMEDAEARMHMDWSDQPNYPRPDYLSSSRKRLAPQLLFKGGILHTWRKKTAVALNKGFFETLPRMTQAPKKEADIAWLIYDLVSINICREAMRFQDRSMSHRFRKEVRSAIREGRRGSYPRSGHGLQIAIQRRKSWLSHLLAAGLSA
jgi:hypothetical protein